jgi:tetratricopeptide (TPR) repeat protein
VGDLLSSLNYNDKINNLYIMLGISYIYCSESYYALENFNIALKNDPKNYLSLKYCAYIYEEKEEYFNTLITLDKLLSINGKDSLILCYYGEILNKMGKYNDAISYFTRAANIDPENVYNLNKRAITYYILQEYDKALSDFNRVIQMDSSNSLAYYYKGLIYYIMKNISSSIVEFEKCIEIDSNNYLAKIQVYYLKYSQFTDIENSHNLFTEINQISNINNNTDKSLFFNRCKIYIELKKYKEAKSDLDILFELDKSISFIYLLQKYSDFWSYLLHEFFGTNNNKINQLGFTNEFNIYMYMGKYN